MEAKKTKSNDIRAYTVSTKNILSPIVNFIIETFPSLDVTETSFF